MRKILKTSEWILVVSFVFLLISLLVVSRLHEHRKKMQLTQHALPVEEKPFAITITGEVASPGIFSASPGTRLGDIVKKSRPKRFANLRSLDLDRPIESSMEIEIEALNEIVVLVEGAVREPTSLQVAAGSRICDLKSRVPCSDDADLKFFKRRRLLKDKEVLIVPVKDPAKRELD